MKRAHALLISLMIGAAALFGIVAATHTARLGHSAQQPKVSSAQIVARNRVLDQNEAKLRRILAQKQPAVSSARPAPAQKVVYVRPAPHVVTIHHPGGGEHEAEGDGRDSEGFDD
jgi:hypothetical protein